MSSNVLIFVGIVITCLVYESHADQDKILLINDRSHRYDQTYTIVTGNHRSKREQPLKIDVNVDNQHRSPFLKHDTSHVHRCDENSYTKLYSCSHLADCT
jgi:hypothetical protein